MKLIINDKSEILAFTVFGDVDNSLEYNGEVPEDFRDKFKPKFYMLVDGVIVENPNYVKPEPPEIGPSVIEQQVAALGYQQMQDNQDKQKLVKQNAQMAYQIMQIQQQLGGQKA
ncbi:DUF2977 domain-containing protein [Pediococcus pentosaceus]|uniref:DUF2977 domain-containing protein n=1 Tax=Pediococcus pentosaceus TaxID=1255 RepID=UPI0013035542|nr:DUF2977 domain-containing protein [Pediococcus pentosaceus]QGZ70042.1 DUF2977 domain-containing protein [Pediococcus pentosaceus]